MKHSIYTLIAVLLSGSILDAQTFAPAPIDSNSAQLADNSPGQSPYLGAVCIYSQMPQVPERLPAVEPLAGESKTASMSQGSESGGTMEAVYKNGILIAVRDKQGRLFELKTNGRIQFRYAGFSRETDSYTDNAGTTIPVRNRSRFDIERARLIFSGHVFDESWSYFLQLDGDTDRGSQVVFFDYWWSYHLEDVLEIRLGKAKVPGSRQWLLSAFNTRLVDRPLAADFFRPDRTQGIWAIGKIHDSFQYQAMLGNSSRSAGQTPQQVNDKFTAALSLKWEPWGKFGSALIDFDCGDHALVQLGASCVYAQQSGLDNAGSPIRESRAVRLSDGTILVAPGALTPAVTVDTYDTVLVSLDAAWKYRGWSIDGEYYLRSIENLRGNGALPTSSLFQQGFFVEGGAFIVPQLLDFNARYSQVSGDYGDSSEYAVGVGYFPRRTANVKFSFDVTWLDGAPTTVTGTDILVGDEGVLYRAQFQAMF